MFEAMADDVNELAAAGSWHSLGRDDLSDAITKVKRKNLARDLKRSRSGLFGQYLHGALEGHLCRG